MNTFKSVLLHFHKAQQETMMRLDDGNSYQGKIMEVGDDFLTISAMGLNGFGTIIQLSHIVSFQKAGQ